MGNRTRSIVIGIVVLVVLALGFAAYQFVMFQRAVNDLPGQGYEVVFVEDGIGERYVLTNTTLMRTLDTSRDDGVVIYERVPTPSAPDTYAVLATMPGVEGMVAGVVRADQTFTPFVGGGTNKAELTVREDGLVVFTTVPVASVSVAAPSDPDAAEDGVEQTFTASRPTTVPADVPALTLNSQLIAFTIDSTRSIVALGAGRSPRIAEDGSILAIGLEGVVRIDPATQSRSVVIPAPTSDVIYGSLSPSGTLAALPGPGNTTIDFYRLHDGGADNIGFLEREEGGSIRIAFIDDARFFLRTGPGTAWAYKVPTQKLPIATPYAILPITQ